VVRVPPMRPPSLAFLVFAMAALLLFTSPSARASGPNDGLMPDPSLDRASPRRALDGFITAAERGDYPKAAHFLDLRAVPKARQEVEGPELAEKLGYVLAHTPRIDLDKVPDDPETLRANDPGPVVAATVYLEDDTVPIGLSRIRFEDGGTRWVVARTTVAMIPVMYNAMARSPLEDHVPSILTGVVMGNAIWQWLALIISIPMSILVAWALSWVIFRAAETIARCTPTKADDLLIASSRRPGRLALIAVLVSTLTNPLRLTVAVQHFIAHVCFSVLVVAGGWFAVGLVGAFTRWFEERIPAGPEHELAHRGARTRLVVLERVAEVLVSIVAVAVVLVQFDVVRSVGLSLLASAGIAGVVVGIAAQRSLGGIIAGVQLSITQPIRIGDTVMIEGENGTIESINLTYVVVRLWDERRMVVPVTRFLEQPFQNWTKVASAMTGTVTLACDFATPVELVRKELVRICTTSAHWDKRACSLQVLDAGERSITLRAVVSSVTAGESWDLRCEVREQLVRFLCLLDGGRYLPRGREEWRRETRDGGQDGVDAADKTKPRTGGS
jgi:small-conductance mechanosensitive channel